MVHGCRSDDEVRLRERVPRLSAFLNQKPPLENNVFGNLENPFAKHGPNLTREPVIEVGAAGGLTDQLYAETNLGQGYRADVKLIERTTGNERNNLCSGLGRRSSERILVSSNHAIRTQCHAQAYARVQAPARSL